MASSASRTEIEKYSDDVLKNRVRCELADCCKCGTSPHLFIRHECRLRKFRILYNMLVHVVVCLVIRWKCTGCKKTFTQQPPFALPLKRYTRETILDTSGSYLEDEKSSYRKSVREEGASFLYASTAGNDLPTSKELAHSTPYRWITSLSSFKEIPRRTLDLILQQEPDSPICRVLASLMVSPNKFVKAARESVLKRCRQLIHLEVKYRVVFGVSIFPCFATRCGWG